MKNNYIITKDIATVTDSNGQTFIIDAEDIGVLDLCAWFVDKSDGYVKGTVNGKAARLHRHLLNYPDAIVDHINRDKTDNRKANLRECTITESNWNRGAQQPNKTGLKGVAFCQSRDRRKKYRAQITVNGKRVRLGWFETETEASAAYKAAALKYYGEFAAK